MSLLDVNVLVQVHREDADFHGEMKAWLTRALNDPVGVACSDLVLSGFLRVVTHPKIFNIPSPLDVALEFAEDLRSRDKFFILSPGPAHWEIFTDLCLHSDARGNLVPDAYHAALAVEMGCQWVSLDRGFARYPDLRWCYPLD